MIAELITLLRAEPDQPALVDGTIRPASASDRLKICRMECACFGWGRLLGGLWMRVGSPGTQTWVAEIEGDRVGYLISYPRMLDGRSVTYVGGIGVMPGYRKFGAGTRLMRTVLAAHKSVWLHVRAGNVAAMRLYLKLGMREVRRLLEFYANGEDAVVMATPDLLFEARPAPAGD